MSRSLAAVCAVAALALLAGCGGDDRRQAAPPATTPSGGTVTAEATSGLLGPAAAVQQDGREQIIGEGGKISPDADRPTGAQRNGVAGGVACASTTASPSRSNLRSISASILCLLNAERSAAGLPPVRSNRQLARASKLMARLMVAKRFFSHDTPDGRSLLDRVKPTGYIRGRWSLGENIAWGSGALASPRAIVNGWMNSKGHRANILHAKFRDIGLGIRLGAPGRGLSGGATYVTDFGRHG